MPTSPKIDRPARATRAFHLLLMLLPPSVHAAPTASEADHLGDLPVVLSATRLSQAPADAPGAVTVLDREMIRASGARNIYELFRLVPGFQVGLHTGNQPMVTYHGLSDDAPRRMLVQVDGRSIYSPYLISGVEWNQIGVDIDDIERIEVFRGSNSAAYGSNAFLGVANIITRSPSETLGAAVRYRVGDSGVNDVGVRLGQQLGDVAVRLTASRNYDRGFPGLNDWRTSELATLNADWRVSADTVSLSGTLILKTVPATPEDAELGPGGAHVRVYVLRLARPLCAAPNPQDELNQAADDVREVQVVVAEDRLAALLRARLGRHVVVEGEAWSWHTAHHYTPALISLEKLSLASR